MDQVFAIAAGGADQVASLWGHLPEADFLTNIAKMDAMAHVAASNHPGVPFLYCTAVEAMQRWRGLADRTAPQLDIAEQAQGEAVTLLVNTSEPIFQPVPFVAVKDIFTPYLSPGYGFGPSATIWPHRGAEHRRPRKCLGANGMR